MTDEADVIGAFLHLGFIPRPNRIAAYRSFAARAIRGAEEHAVSDRVAHVQKVLEESVIPAGPGPHVVPLSSGLDSRLVFALLRRHLNANEVHVVTYGSARTWDFELAPRVAEALGAETERFDLADLSFDIEDFRAAARSGASWTHMLGAVVVRKIAAQLPVDCTVWTGYLGDPLAGSHLPPTVSWDWSEGIERLAAKTNLWGSDSHPTAAHLGSLIPEGPNEGLEDLEPYDHLYLLVRQPCQMRPCVLPNDPRFLAPFEDLRVVGAFLTLPRAERFQRKLYREVIARVAPDVARLPGSATGGLPHDVTRRRRRATGLWRRAMASGRRRLPRFRWPAPGWTNFIDLDDAFRHREDFRVLASTCVSQLAGREMPPWLNVARLHADHLAGRANNGDALMRTCALAVSLEICPDPFAAAADNVIGWGIDI
ncbi:MAG: asparagine synthase-related protein [Acidimicrobiales bacterium]